MLFGLFAIAGFAQRAPDGALSFPLFVVDAAPIAILAGLAASIVHWNALSSTRDWLMIPTASLTSLVMIIALQLLLNWRTPSMLRVTAGFLPLAAVGLVDALRSSPTGVVQPAGWTGMLSVAGLLMLVVAATMRARAFDRYKAYFALDRDNGLRWLPAAAGAVGIVLVRWLHSTDERHSQLLYWSLAPLPLRVDRRGVADPRGRFSERAHAGG